jgi:hypothetical protein
MFPRAAGELLEAWEASRGARAQRRALTLLERTSGVAVEALAALPVGHVDALLLELRERAFGMRMDCETRCPVCAERLEFTLDTAALRVAPSIVQAPMQQVELDGVQADFHLPTIVDLDACADMATAGDAARALLARCIERVEPADAMLDGTLAAAIAERIAALDPQADMPMRLTCPQCAHVWIESFDIAAFLAREVDDWAQRLLDEIHVLAASYGWSERDIMALSPARRRYYVERVNG